MDQSTKKDIIKIMAGVAVCDLVMIAVFAAIGKFSLGVILGVLLSFAVTLLNYLHLASSINKAMSMAEGGQAYLQRSYTVRLLLQAACAIIAYLVPQIDIYAAVIPLFFPRLALYAMGFFEKKNAKKEGEEN